MRIRQSSEGIGGVEATRWVRQKGLKDWGYISHQKGLAEWKQRGGYVRRD